MNGVQIYEFPKAKGIVVSGDIHGDFTKLVYKVCIQYNMTDTLIVVAGDCGFGFERYGFYENIYNRCRERLAKANNWFVFVRGNHDNPAYFYGEKVNYKRWKAIPDYSLIKACGHTILCVGGAKSVDRTYRMTSKYFHLKPKELLSPNVYWYNERPVYDEERLDEIDKICAIDTVITHTAPSFCELSSHHGIQDWLIHDEDLYDDLKKERKAMDDLHAYIYAHNHPLQYWFYGHFHESWHSEIEGVKYSMLDCMELRELR